MSKTLQTKQPVVAILGHVDHGKSTLLDYIRKTNVVDGEAGGITQKISAYEVTVDGRKITFLDTPGHESFASMRERGVEIADIAILVVSAEDGVKTQTLDAFKKIDNAKVPFIVAINKIDKSGADVERTKLNLVENGIYLEGLGGDVPYVAISAKVGTGISELLENINLLADLHDLKFDTEMEATGRVLESFVDAKRGISATLVIKDGILPAQGAILAGCALSPIRIVEDFLGKAIKTPVAGQAIKVTGFDQVPSAGAIFISSKDKRSLEEIQSEEKNNTKRDILDVKTYRNAKVVIPTIIKTDSAGTLEALKYEIKKFETEEIKIKIIGEGIGNISESDILQASSDERVIIIGFNVKVEGKARDQAERFNIQPQVFDIIYKAAEWFKVEMDNLIPFEEIEKQIGKLKVIKTFSVNKDIHVIGGKVIEGVLRDGAKIKIIRRDFEIGKGKITELQQSKMKVKEVLTDLECGVMINTKHDMIPGDMVVAFEVEKKKII